MRSVSRFRRLQVSAAVIFFCALCSASFAQTNSKPSPQGPLEPVIARARSALSLTDEQTNALREILLHHAARLQSLHNRLQQEPYAPKLQEDIAAEMKSIHEEFTPRLTAAQKDQFQNLQAFLGPPPFVLINPLPRSVPEGALKADRLIQPISKTGSPKHPALTEDGKILQLLNRATFGPRPGDLNLVRKMGINKFIDWQLHSERIDDSQLETRLSVLPTLHMAPTELLTFYPQPNVAEQRAKDKKAPPVFGRPAQILVELDQQKLLRAALSQRQLLEVMTDFWFNHFNVFAYKGFDLNLLTSYERDVIRPHALGKFSDLLLAVAQSPAMLFYLDNWLSQSPNSKLPRPQPMNALPPRMANATAMPAKPPTSTTGINENYARELMELHTLGVNGGYTQKDVQEVARAFTGWTIDRAGQSPSFVFRPWMHDTGGKTILGETIPAGGGISDGEHVIELLARHPSTARFIATELCARFVSDHPSPLLVKHIAQVFLKTDGDIRETVRALLTSPEFYSAKNFRSKTKSPLELVASTLRAVDGDTNGAPALHFWLQRMGEPLYVCQPPTGYGEDSSIWMNAGVFFNRINFLGAFVNHQIPGTTFEAQRLDPPDEEQDVNQLTNHLAALTIHTRPSPNDLRAIEEVATSPGLSLAPKGNTGTPQVKTVAYPTPNGSKAGPVEDAQTVSRILELLLGSEDFQRK
ncbi:MAG: DUF1800 domain-containing protein [Acidobacteriia bacterium]|nr:DUF1800 domain-containing protein [Terriglobia bacterium]